MALSENDIELIEKYFEKNLNEEESALFKEKEKTADFAQEVILRRAMIAAIRLEDRKLLKEELKKEVKNITLSSTSSSPRNIKWSYAVAASISLLVIATYFVLPSSNSLFEIYYSPFPENPITRSESQEIDHYDLAMQQYSLGNYERALDNFLNINEESTQEEVSLYIGNCYLGIDEPKKAISYFKLVANPDLEQIKIHAQWFLALAYIKNHNKHEACKILHDISLSGNFYSAKSKQLLKKLRWTYY